MYELSNDERIYFGLDLIKDNWEKVILSGDKYLPESILYFDKDIIKKHIISTEISYLEKQYDELTRDKSVLLPKTAKGKEQKLTISVMEKRTPIGMYLSINCGILRIGNYNTQTTFYSSSWDKNQEINKSIPEFITEFIKSSTDKHFDEISIFKKSKRKNIKYKSGDYFCFKVDRNNYGFGRILLDVNKIRKENLIESNHGLFLLMGPQLLVQIFAFISDKKQIDIEFLDKQAIMPSDVMMDNLIFYGEYEIIGHKNIKDEEYDFPISYGKRLDRKPFVFLQWGLIHKELPIEKFNKYLNGTKSHEINPYGYYGVGFSPKYDKRDIIQTIDNNGIYDYTKAEHYKSDTDLRNPLNIKIKEEIFYAFGLDPNKDYCENSVLTETVLPSEIDKKKIK